MNKQELIEKYKNLEGVWNANGAEIARQCFLRDLEQLNEIDTNTFRYRDVVDRLKELAKIDRVSWITKIMEDFRQECDMISKKVTVPQFVADWIEYCKGTGVNLQRAFNMEDLDFYNYANQKDDLKLKEFFETENNQDLFARAWLDGYEVEKEKRYYVRFKGMESDDFNYLNFIKFQHAWVLSSLKIDKKFRTEHTKKQLEEAGFGWVFDCPGIEIEEVTE